MTLEKVILEPADTTIEGFIGQLKSRHTAKAYRHDLNQLQDFISTLSTSALTLTTDQAHAYVASLTSSRLSPQSVRRRISAARSFYRYLLAKEEISLNPFAGVQMPAMDQDVKPLQVLTQEEIEHCFQVLVDEFKSILHASEDAPSSRMLRRRTFYAVRRRAIVALLIYSDLRLAELLNLWLSSFEQTATGFQLTITAPQGKSRILPLNTDCLPELIGWIKLRREIPTTANHLFVGYTGAPCTRMSIRQIMKWLQARVKIDHALNPELFKRSFLHRQSVESASAQI